SGSGGLGDDAGIIKFVNETSGTLTITNSTSGGGAGTRYLSTGAASTTDPFTYESVITHPPIIENLGTITNQTTLTTQVAPEIQNQGTLAINSGKLVLQKQFETSGDVIIEYQSELNISGYSGELSSDPYGGDPYGGDPYGGGSGSGSGSGGTVDTRISYTQTAGSTTINGGQLTATGDAIIQAGSLSGIGLIGTDLINQGQMTLAPGLGVLSVDGDFTQTSSGSLYLDATSQPNHQADSLAVKGKVTLDGDFFLDTTYLISPPNMIHLIDNDGSDAIVGQFSNVDEGDVTGIAGINQPFSYEGGTGNDFTFGFRLPSISVSNVKLNEGNSGVTDFVFTVSLDGGYSSPVTVNYSTEDDSALAGEDYISTSGTLTFYPNDPLSQTVTVSVIGDLVPERRERFSLVLTDATNSIVENGTGVGSIMDDDGFSGAKDNLGDEFWLTFPANYQTGDQQDLILFLTGPDDAIGNVEILGLSFSTTFEVKANQITAISLPQGADLGTAIDQIENKGIHITADVEIAVYGLNLVTYTSDAYLGLPVDILDDKYVVLGWKNSGIGAGTQFAIVASEDNTLVTITPTAQVGARQAGVSYQIELDAGQTYQLRNSDYPADLSGSIVQADAPVAVFAGHECANIPEGVTYCDYVVEQLTPTSTWGKDFISVPLAARQNGDTFRVIASEDDTVIQVNGTVVATLDAGEIYEDIFTTVSHIESSQPILVAQHSHGSSFDGALGDPFMMMIAPTEQFLDNYTVGTPVNATSTGYSSTQFVDNFLNIVIPSDAIASLRLDGQPLDAGIAFEQVGMTGYSGASIPVTTGSHHLSADAPFGVYTYGFNTDDSYGYPGGLALARIADVQTLALTPPEQTAYVNSMQSVSATIKDANGVGIAGVRVDFVVSGANSITGSTFTNAFGVAEFFYTGTNVGDDSIVATFSSLTATAEKTWIAAAPAIEILSPAPFTDYTPGSGILITGKATAADPSVPVVAVYMDGVPVDALDADGKFFVSTSVEAANQVYSFTAIDALGNQATTTLTLDIFARSRGPINLSTLSDVSTIDADYGITSFDFRTNKLYAELSITNSGTYAINNPLLVGVKNISSATVFPSGYAGITADGIPYFDFSSFVTGDTLEPGESTLRGILQFDNPNRETFTYELVLLGQLNRAPEFVSSPPVSVTSGTPYSYPVTAFDADQDEIEYSLVAGPSGITLDSQTGALTWNPSTGDVGNHNLTIQADDGRGARTLQSFVLSVEASTGNRPPVFTSVPVTTAYVGTEYQADVAVSDPDFDTVTLSLATAVAGLAVASTGDRSGQLTWTPTASQVGTHLITIEADDSGAGGITEQSFMIRVLPAQGNSAPHILSDPITTATAGVAYHYGLVAIDPDDDDLAYTLSSAPSGMTIDAETGSINWTPTSGTSGTTEVTVRVDDGHGWFDEQTCDLAWINATPGTLSGTVFDDQDADGIRDGGEPALSGWTVYLDANRNNKPESGETNAVTNASGQYSFTNVPIGEYTIGIVKQPDWALNVPTTRVHTGTLSGGQTVSGLDFAFVTKTGGNAKPVFQSVPITTAVMGNTYQYRPTAFDADGDELTYSLAYGPRGMTIDPATGSLAWNPAEDENFYVDVTLRVDDGNGGVALQPFQVFLTVAENSAPVFTSQPHGPASVGVAWTYNASATDPDGDSVTYSLDNESLARGIVIHSTTGAVTWTPTAVGDYTLNVTASDDRDGSRTQSFTLAVRNNTPPQFDTVPPIPGYVGEVYSYAIDVSDGDADDLTLTLDSTSVARGMTLSGNASTGYTLNWTPAAEGDYPVTLSLSDGESRVTQVFVLPVIAPVVESFPPQITSSPQGPIYAGSPSAWSYTIFANDPDGDDNELTFALELPSSNSEVTLTGNVLSWHPTNPGSETFRIVVTDEDNESTVQSFTATALSSRVGALPEITSVPTGPAVRGNTYQYQVVAFDPNGDPLTYALAEPVAGASIDPQTGLLSFTPDSASSVDFDIEVSDGIDGTRTQSFTLDIVSPPGTPPRITSSPVGPAVSNQAWNYTLAAIDSQGDAITYALDAVSSSNGTESVSFNSTTRTLTWTPTDADLTIIVTLSATDTDGTTPQTFTLGSIAPPSTGGSNESPVFVSQPQGPVLVGQLWTYVAKATDADDDTLTYALDSASVTAGLSINSATGRIQWQPTTTGDFPVSVTADDGNGGTATQSFTVTVGRSNVAPAIISKPSGPAMVDSPWNYTIVASDTNDSVSTLTYELLSPATSAEISFNSTTGTLTWTAPSETSQSFEVKVTDPHGASATQSFTVNAVDPPITSNVAPVFVSAAPSVVRAGELYRYAARAVDADGDALTYSLSSSPVGMTIHPTTGLVSWTPDSVGTYAVTVAASDGINSAITQSFSVTVAAPVRPNQAPEITSQPTGPASRHLAWSYQVKATDPEGDTLTYSLDTSAVPTAAMGDLAINSSTGLITWTPTVAGSFVVKVYATDPMGANDGQQFTLPVLENAPPQFITSPPTQSIQMGDAVSYDADAVDPNPGDTITYALDQVSLDRGMTINGS
ncbi:Na-Ca exchanger/integrin-beta4 domain protein, partial [Rhodopirellula maiorica SM1]